MWHSGRKHSFGSYSFGYGPYSYAFPMAVLWLSYGAPKVPMASWPKTNLGYHSNGFGPCSNNFPMNSYDFLVVLMWSSYGIQAKT